MKLEEIGFYTLSDERVRNASMHSPLQRCELILTDKCNFNCSYCRGLREDLRGEIPFELAKTILEFWCGEDLKNIRFSGGEPTLYLGLDRLVLFCKKNGVERIALSTNGYSNLEYYKYLIKCGVNDISISLDACCATFGDSMCGVPGGWEIVTNNIRELAKLTYLTVGIVFTELTAHTIKDTINFASNLGVSDIRVIPAAQHTKTNYVFQNIDIHLLEKHPILKYRVNNFLSGKSVRGMTELDYNKCPLVLDDMAVAQGYHFPCIIYMREYGNPIGDIYKGKPSKEIRRERKCWYLLHDVYKDKICKENCLDVCIDYNNKYNSSMKGVV